MTESALNEAVQEMMEKGRYDDAYQILQRQLPFLSDSTARSRVLERLGYIEQRWGRHPRALALLEEARSLAGTKPSPALLLNMGALLTKLDRHADAARLTEQLVALLSKHAARLAAKPPKQSTLAKPDPSKRRTLPTIPLLAMAQCNLAVCYAGMGNRSEALQAMTDSELTALQLESSHPLAREVRRNGDLLRRQINSETANIGLVSPFMNSGTQTLQSTPQTASSAPFLPPIATRSSATQLVSTSGPPQQPASTQPTSRPPQVFSSEGNFASFLPRIPASPQTLSKTPRPAPAPVTTVVVRDPAPPSLPPTGTKFRRPHSAGEVPLRITPGPHAELWYLNAKPSRGKHEAELQERLNFAIFRASSVARVAHLAGRVHEDHLSYVTPTVSRPPPGHLAVVVSTHRQLSDRVFVRAPRSRAEQVAIQEYEAKRQNRGGPATRRGTQPGISVVDIGENYHRNLPRQLEFVGEPNTGATALKPSMGWISRDISPAVSPNARTQKQAAAHAQPIFGDNEERPYTAVQRSALARAEALSRIQIEEWEASSLSSLCDTSIKLLELGLEERVARSEIDTKALALLNKLFSQGEVARFELLRLAPAAVAARAVAEARAAALERFLFETGRLQMEETTLRRYIEDRHAAEVSAISRLLVGGGSREARMTFQRLLYCLVVEESRGRYEITEAHTSSLMKMVSSFRNLQ
eukprot:TRINITY_DN9357_c0_g1_i1.p1 TRINITY_DN9357_c0_g1~~TRINITY_DN9357_c0_g1_i1.p1  ORF type:complete len:698 (+),score=85.06 TRINITY_DN9357_c0_g1_i1:25-2118(+)